MALLPIPFAKHTTYPGHSGIDFPQPAGALVKAAGPGKIVGRGYTARAGYYVRVQYDDGARRVMSCHFRNLGSTPNVGTRVKEGSVIGAVGSTGNSTGNHLHQEVTGAYSSAGYWKHHDRNRIVGQGGAATTGRNLTKRPVRDIQRVVGAKQDGKYGPETTAKVIAWQRRNGLTADGIWGVQSDAKAFAPSSSARPTLRRGSKGAHVLTLQKRLKSAYSLYAGKLALDSDYGPATERAVKEFQRRSGLTPDGIVGPKTWKALGL